MNCIFLGGAMAPMEHPLDTPLKSVPTDDMLPNILLPLVTLILLLDFIFINTYFLFWEA
jgi:hypothetical protein